MRAFALAILAAAPLVADALPHIDGETLTGKRMALPDAANGHLALLVIGYTHASHNQTKVWRARAFHDLGDRLAVYSIAVLQDAPRLVRGMAVHGIKSSTTQAQRDHTLVIYHFEKELKLVTGFERPDDAYLLLLDSAGEIRWKFHGGVTDAAVEELRKAAEGTDLSRRSTWMVPTGPTLEFSIGTIASGWRLAYSNNSRFIRGSGKDLQ